MKATDNTNWKVQVERRPDKYTAVNTIQQFLTNRGSFSKTFILNAGSRVSLFFFSTIRNSTLLNQCEKAVPPLIFQNLIRQWIVKIHFAVAHNVKLIGLGWGWQIEIK